jgi:AraC-like DNA-binding protein
VKAVAKIRLFVRSPEERYVAGNSWLAFCTKGIAGFIMWGSSTVDDILELLSALPVAGSPLAEPRLRYVDIRRIHAIPPASFDLFARYFTEHSEPLAKAVRQVAIVHAQGLAAAIATGFGAVAPMRYPVRSFTEPVEGLGWLGAAAPVPLSARLDALVAERSGTTRFRHDLHAALDASLPDATIARSASSLGMSTRSLQRRLSHEKSTFQRELNHVRIRRAQELLAATTFPLSRVALDVGFASPNHFAAVFRKATGDTPRQWRARAVARGPQ